MVDESIRITFLYDSLMSEDCTLPLSGMIRTVPASEAGGATSETSFGQVSQDCGGLSLGQPFGDR
jgi:hypothetical protein